MKEDILDNKRCCVCSSPNIEIVYKRPLMPLGGQLVKFEDEFKPELFYPPHHTIYLDCSTSQTIELVPDNLLRSENKYVSITSRCETTYIYSTEKIDDSVDYVLMLACLHQDEIIDSLKSFTDKGGKIIIPTPEVKIYGRESGRK